MGTASAGAAVGFDPYEQCGDNTLLDTSSSPRSGTLGTLLPSTPKLSALQQNPFGICKSCTSTSAAGLHYSG